MKTKFLQRCWGTNKDEQAYADAVLVRIPHSSEVLVRCPDCKKLLARRKNRRIRSHGVYVR